MKIIEITPGQSYTTARELPNKKRRWINGTQKSAGGNSGTMKPARIVPNAARGVFADQQKRDRELTEQNQRILVLHNGKRRWMTMKEFKEGTWRSL